MAHRREPVSRRAARSQPQGSGGRGLGSRRRRAAEERRSRTRRSSAALEEVLRQTLPRHAHEPGGPQGSGAGAGRTAVEVHRSGTSRPRRRPLEVRRSIGCSSRSIAPRSWSRRCGSGRARTTPTTAGASRSAICSPSRAALPRRSRSSRRCEAADELSPGALPVARRLVSRAEPARSQRARRRCRLQDDAGDIA